MYFELECQPVEILEEKAHPSVIQTIQQVLAKLSGHALKESYTKKPVSARPALETRWPGENLVKIRANWLVTVLDECCYEEVLDLLFSANIVSRYNP